MQSSEHRYLLKMQPAIRVLLFVPNLIGYCRLLLLIASWTQWNKPTLFLGLFITSGALDFIDGMIARRLKQTSAFGAWFDVAIDNLSRSLIWTMLFPSFGFFISSYEWMTFVCTHQLGKIWKAPTTKQPHFVVNVMANNFNTPLGLWVILSIWFLPMWLYCLTFCNMTFTLLNTITTFALVAGRILGFAVETYFVLQHIKGLLQERPEIS